MKLRFPSYAASFTCPCTAQEAARRVIEAAAYPDSRLRLIENRCSDIHKIVLVSYPKEYRNSFLPVVTLNIKELEEGSLVSVSFELRQFVKAFITVYSAFAILFEIFSFVAWLANQLMVLWLFFPLGMLLFALILSSVALKHSSKSILQALFAALNQEGADSLPPLCLRI